MDAKPQKTIDPVEKFIRAGLSKKMTEQFRAPAIFVTSKDMVANLKAHLGNKQPTYPYLFLFISSVSADTDSYVTHRMARFGIPVLVNDDNKQLSMVKLAPTRFEIEATFVTNKYEGLDVDSVDGIVRRWMFCRRNGDLNFKINYGLSDLAISFQMNDSLTIPQRESPADAEPTYQIVANLTLKGYVSEPAVQTRGRINEIVLGDAPPLQPGQQFFPF